MRQLLLTGTGDHRGEQLVCWGPDELGLGDGVRWNGSPWRVSSVYGTRLCLRGLEADVRERPRPDADSLG